MQRAADKNQTLSVPEFLNFRCSQEAMSFEQKKKQPSHFHKVGCFFWPLAKDQKMVPSSFGTVTWFFGTQSLCHLTDPKNRSFSPTFPPHRWVTISHHTTHHSAPYVIWRIFWGLFYTFIRRFPPCTTPFWSTKGQCREGRGGGGISCLLCYALCTTEAGLYSIQQPTSARGRDHPTEAVCV